MVFQYSFITLNNVCKLYVNYLTNNVILSIKIFVLTTLTNSISKLTYKKPSAEKATPLSELDTKNK